MGLSLKKLQTAPKKDNKKSGQRVYLLFLIITFRNQIQRTTLQATTRVRSPSKAILGITFFVKYSIASLVNGSFWPSALIKVAHLESKISEAPLQQTRNPILEPFSSKSSITLIIDFLVELNAKTSKTLYKNYCKQLQVTANYYKL